MTQFNLLKEGVIVMKKVFLGFVCTFLMGNGVFATSASITEEEEKKQIQRLEASFFDKKDEDFWVLNSKEAFNAVTLLIDKNGRWKGEGPAPHYLKFVEELKPEDLPVLQRWLNLNELECFAIADQTEQPNLALIMDYYEELKEAGKVEGNLYKLAWLNFKTMLYELEQKETSSLPAEWVETNRDF